MNNPKQSLVDLIKHLHQRGHNPATSGNYSLRELSHESNGQVIWMSKSGVDKSIFQTSDLLELSLINGQVLNQDVKLNGVRPSDETQVHVAIYQLEPSANCILHSHHADLLILGELFSQDEVIKISNLEIIKAFSGVKSHEEEIYILSIENTQDMEQLAKKIKNLWPNDKKKFVAILLRRHGVYVWGDSVQSAKRHLEALESIANFLWKETQLKYFLKRENC